MLSSTYQSEILKKEHWLRYYTAFKAYFIHLSFNKNIIFNATLDYPKWEALNGNNVVNPKITPVEKPE